MLTKLVITGFVAALATAALIAPVEAGRGNGNGRGNGGGGNSSSAVLTLSPDSVAVGDEYVVSGTGLKANASVSIGMRYSDATYWGLATTDGTGAFTYTTTALSSGEIVHEAYQQKNKHSWSLKASGTLTVQ